MTPFEALQKAAAILQQTAPTREVKIGHKDLDAATLEDVLDELEILRDMFRPYSGDDAKEARDRRPTLCFCPNCAFTFPHLFMPADARRVANMAMRGAYCPRCLATEGIAVAWNGDDSNAPTIFEAFVCECGIEADGFGPPTARINLRFSGEDGDLIKIMRAVNGGKVIVTHTT